MTEKNSFITCKIQKDNHNKSNIRLFDPVLIKDFFFIIIEYYSATINKWINVMLKWINVMLNTLNMVIPSVRIISLYEEVFYGWKELISDQ